MYKKLLFITVVFSFIYILGLGASAAPYSLPSYYRGNASIINVTNPQDFLTTFKDHAVVSVTGNEGVVVTLYTYDPNSAQFIIYTQYNGETSWAVGPSGLFIKRMPINLGVNYIGVYAQLGGYDQFITRRVDRANQSIRDGLKNILINSVDDIVQAIQ